MSRQKKVSAISESVDQVFSVLDRALRATGHLLAKSEEDVHSSESEIDLEGIELPRVLHDPIATLERGRYVLEHGLTSSSKNNSSVDTTSREMAQVARNGTHISEDLLQRMHCDRANSLNNSNKNKS